MKTFASIGVVLSILLNFAYLPDASGKIVLNKSALQRVDPRDLPSLVPDGNLGAFKLALSRQIAACRRKNQKQVFYFGNRKVKLKQYCTRTLKEMLKIARTSADFEGFLARARARFHWYRSLGGDGQGAVRFTGYHFPSLEASLRQDDEFRYPIYRKPDDLVKVTVDGREVWRRRQADGTLSRYFNRREIDFEGKLSGQGYEIAYAKDLLSVFLLHIQGAGALVLPNEKGQGKKGRSGRMILNYAAQNGHSYVSLAKVMKEKGIPAEYLTIPGMRRYFAANPSELPGLLSENPSYVFFKESSEGPYGLDDVVLSDGHSVAIDTRVFPLGAVAFFETTRPRSPASQEIEWVPFSRLAVAQDTGGAIVGAGRVDIYWGEDEYAEFAAGTMNQPGRLYFALLP